MMALRYKNYRNIHVSKYRTAHIDKKSIGEFGYLKSNYKFDELK